MHDLDMRLERLDAEATRDAIAPEPGAIARRGRRRRQLAGSALLVAAVAAAGLVLKPVMVGEPWLARSDVTILLAEGTTVARREAVRARLEAIDGVQKVAYERPAEVYRRLPEKLRRMAGNQGGTPAIGPASMLASFHVTLADPMRVGEFHKAFCGSRKTGACAGGLVLLEHPRG